MMEDNDEEENDDNYPEFPETTNTAMEDNEEEEEGEEQASDMPADDLGQVIVDAVGTLVYHSWIPVMHTTHDPMISMS
jgi:hypothetical protein